MLIANKDMFNAGQKLEYMEYEAINTDTLSQYFRRLAPQEKLCGKDIADMTAEELKLSLISLKLSKIQSRRHMISLLKGYIDWCIFHGKTTNENKIDNIKPEDIVSKVAIQSKMLKSPEQVDRILSTVFTQNYWEQENRETRDKLIFRLYYAGLTVCEMMALKKLDIDVNRLKIRNPLKEGKTYDANEKIASLWEKWSAATFIEKSGERSGKDILEYALVDNDYLFRPILGKKVDSNITVNRTYLNAPILKIFDRYYEETGEYIKVSPDNMRISGIFYKIYRGEQEGVEVTNELIAEYFDIEYDSKRDMQMKTRKHVINYYDWKAAMGYE